MGWKSKTLITLAAEHEDKSRRTESGGVQVTQVSVLHIIEEDSGVSSLPFSRVKSIMLLATEARLPADTIKLMAFATELFLENVARKTFNNAAAMKKKTITSNDLLDVCGRHSYLHFIPEARMIQSISPHKRVVRSQVAGTGEQPNEEAGAIGDDEEKEAGVEMELKDIPQEPGQIA